MTRLRGCEPIGIEVIWEFEEEVGDALRSGEKGSTETKVGEGGVEETRLILGEPGEARQNTLLAGYI